MALDIWTEPAGFSFGINFENLKTDIALPVINDDGVIYSIKITDDTGELPGGLNLNGNHIVGITAPLLRSDPPSIVYNFTVRAYRNLESSERVFSITISKGNIWTQMSGINLCYLPQFGNNINADKIVAGKEYVIAILGTTDFTQIGASSNKVGQVFTATSSGSGNGIASECWINERRSLSKTLPVININGFQYSVISGQLPSGLRIEGSKIIGTPFEVARKTVHTFCLRASNGYQLSDRTFYITLEGEDIPEILTTGGEDGILPIGTNEQYFVLSNSYVDFQIDAIDNDLPAGQSLNFFIADNEGSLPPGLVLTTDGRIVGYVQPLISIKPEDGNGYYDIGYYDTVAYDWGYRPSNGYDSYLYDSIVYDYSLGARGPTKLNRYFEFIVSVTDGDTVAKRKFKIFVVSDDYFRADNTVWLNGTGLFTADVTYLRSPIWVTPSYLGRYRANNYVTLVIDTYDVQNVVYRLELVNCDITAKTLKLSPTDNTIGSTSITITDPTGVPQVGQYFTFDGKFNGGTERIYYIYQVTPLNNNRYRLSFSPSELPLDILIPDNIEFFIGSLSVLPPGMSFDVLGAEVFGAVPYQPALTTSYQFTITATRLDIKEEIAESSRKFTIEIIGNVDSDISWITNPNLGTINANFVSTLSVSAISTLSNSLILYTIVEGALPPGLTLNLDGEIIGKVNQYTNIEAGMLGLTTFDRLSPSTFFDNSETTFDRSYTFTVSARDYYNLSNITRNFTIYVNALSQVLYSNISVKPFLKLDQRSTWKEFINDSSIFSPESIYRPNDKNFGIQTDLSMIIYAGLETVEIAKYVSAMGLNHKRKRFTFGNVKSSVAVIPGTRNPVYEVVYIEMQDPLEPNNRRLPNRLTNLGNQPQKLRTDLSNNIWKPSTNTDSIPSVRPDPILSADSTGYLISDPNYGTYYPNSVTNWRERLENWKIDPSNPNSEGLLHERNYLPLWMRSIQPGTKQEIGFKLVVPLCYCKVGTSADIILNIKFSDFDFKLIDYTVDRYIIDAVEGSTVDKYLIFRNDRVTV